jgi:hypothetical protein
MPKIGIGRAMYIYAASKLWPWREFACHSIEVSVWQLQVFEWRCPTPVSTIKYSNNIQAGNGPFPQV